MSRTHSSIINVIILYSWSRVRWLMDGMSERVIWGGSWVSNGKNGYYPTTYILLRELIKWYQSLCGLMCVLEIIKHMWTTYYLRSVTTNNKQGLKKRTNIDECQHTDLWTSCKMEWLQCMWVGWWSHDIIVVHYAYLCFVGCTLSLPEVIGESYNHTGQQAKQRISNDEERNILSAGISLCVCSTYIYRSTDVITFVLVVIRYDITTFNI